MKRPAGWAALAGFASAAAGLGASELIAGIFAPSASPLVSIGTWLIDLAPSWAKETMIALFGTGDKPALIVLLVVAVSVLGALAGILQRRRPPWGALVFVALGVVSLVAALTRPESGMLSSVPAAAGTVLAAILLDRLIRRVRDGLDADRTSARPEATPRSVGDRRNFLRLSAVAGTAGLVAVAGGQWIGSSARRARDLIADVRLPAATKTAAAPPSGASFSIDGLPPVITPNDDFYRIDTALVVPEIDPADWSLRITGMVDEEVEITWNELLALPLEESTTTLLCVSNEVGGDLISTATWLGYPIRHLLERAGPSPDADMVLSRSTDGFTAGSPIDALTDDRNAIVAVGMNGEALPVEHGFPARLVVPGLYGYVSATKWVVELEVTRYDRASAYWTDRGWGERGPVKLSSRIDVVSPAADGTVTLAGFAWQPGTGIETVEVQIDDGDWRAAELADEISVDTWRQWRALVEVEPGNHVARVRATSKTGEVQTAKEQGVLPDGATGLDARRFAL
ncbi:molybdopterin-dependent oxidoreductase [Herbiconiux sp. L3-i23]|uniref:molybdopterin-dependent oxidoreductase n=1 Tax=Herbiconiux sp. L3-i23 TaxID=2905871 RepID=UPI0020512867|nr:molybdopterin-dependent oxidoreductase [Herbiconiux sp. L3-i23]BDI23181.1 putative oxidoreductase [Herbiconiux sp. L3-i23]